MSKIKSSLVYHYSGYIREHNQPYYVLTDNKEILLAEPKGADFDVAAFAKYLQNGLNKFK